MRSNVETKQGHSKHVHACMCTCNAFFPFWFRALYFTAYSQVKQYYNTIFKYESAPVHLCSAVTAGKLNFYDGIIACDIIVATSNYLLYIYFLQVLWPQLAPAPCG